GFAEPYAFMPGPDEAFAFKALLHPDSLLLECRALDGVAGTHVEHSPRGRVDVQPSTVDIDAHDEIGSGLEDGGELGALAFGGCHLPGRLGLGPLIEPKELDEHAHLGAQHI